MLPDITTIPLPLPLKMGRFNCYLLKLDDNCLLIDTGSSHGHAVLDRAWRMPAFVRAISSGSFLLPRRTALVKIFSSLTYD
jgi:hypothetical protein